MSESPNARSVAASQSERSEIIFPADTNPLGHLFAPVHLGDVLIVGGSVNRAFKTSMEIGVKAMVEDVREGNYRHVASAYLTFVAFDNAGQRIDVPQIIPETDHQRRRFDDAGRRREMRSGEVQRKKELRATLTPEWHL